ncbi:Arginyl-tRNA synthetase [Mycoplasma haemocanis str. Illinois]|uniref:Arginine--tRNA ligase n=1 Tax=Mycoplasma haemocanis (strain Illinois) TaxID=1111676 RepID=H6N5L8_MYCHN|nr:arginine--tRNA ligase [Mycoplasma haemocanis]AEW44977.1 Arginyl-tRNA synthetase [Mycoplasma haemocanis str. Illinois]
MQKIKDYLSSEFNLAAQALGYRLGRIEASFDFTKDYKFGDIFTNFACQISSKYKKNPKEVGEALLKQAGELKYVSSAKVEKNGFINIFLSPEIFSEYYLEILEKKEDIWRKHPINSWYFIEIVSANPTGLLHIGHARNGIFSDTLANLLEYGGYFVHREYLVNNLGNQIKELLESVWIKYKAKLTSIPRESNIKAVKYNGKEIDECVDYLISTHGQKWIFDRNIFESKSYPELEKLVVSYFLNEIEKDLARYNIEVNTWKFESSFVNAESINDLFKSIRGYLKVKGGAIWFKAGEILDGCKDEVLIKNDGKHTYYCQDLIYHLYKLNLLGSEGKIINVLGSDHYGHIDKLKAFLKIKEVEDDRVHFICMQLVKLIEQSTLVKISKRDSKVIYLRDLMNYMSYEEARWFLVSQHPDSPLEIDITRLKQKNYNNPSFYVMYAYSRIFQILRKHGEPDFYSKKEVSFKTITEGMEKTIMNTLMQWDEVINEAIETLQPYRITQYLFKLAKEFHAFYEETKLLQDGHEEEWLRDRLALLNAAKYTIHSGLSILKIKPKSVI